jgi:hypothetical protein
MKNEMIFMGCVFVLGQNAQTHRLIPAYVTRNTQQSTENNKLTISNSALENAKKHPQGLFSVFWKEKPIHYYHMIMLT